MTIQEAELWIRRLEGGNSFDEYRPSSNLSIVLRLMLHSHLKMATIQRMTVEKYRAREYVTKRGGKIVYTFEVTPEDDCIVEKHIRENRLEEGDLLIQVSDRSMRYKFQNMVSAYGVSGRRPEMADLYFAGLGRESKEMKRI